MSRCDAVRWAYAIRKYATGWLGGLGLGMATSLAVTGSDFDAVGVCALIVSIFMHGSLHGVASSFLDALYEQGNKR